MIATFLLAVALSAQAQPSDDLALLENAYAARNTPEASHYRQIWTILDGPLQRLDAIGLLERGGRSRNQHATQRPLNHNKKGVLAIRENASET